MHSFLFSCVKSLAAMLMLTFLQCTLYSTFMRKFAIASKVLFEPNNDT